MKKYIELSIKGEDEAIVAFVDGLKNYASDAFKFKELM